MDILIDGRKVQYIDCGSGPQVLLLHGWGAPAATYRLIIDHLSPHCRVVAPDLPGFGGSAEPPDAWDVDGYAEFVCRFATAVGLDAPVLIGHSNGGRIAIKLLTRDGCPLRVPKAVLIDSAGIKPRRGARYYVKVYAYKAAKRLCRLPGIRHAFPHAVERAQARFGSADYKDASPLMRQAMVKAVNEDLQALLPRIRVPTLLIWGDQDTATPLSDGQTMERLIPDAGLVTLAGAGHFSFAERWPQCSRVLDSFLHLPPAAGGQPAP